MPEETTAGLAAKAGQVLAWVPKGEVVGSEPPQVACVVLPKAAGLEQSLGTGLGLELPVFHPGQSCQKSWFVLLPIRGPSHSLCAAPESIGSFQVGMGLQKLGAGRLVAPVTKAMLSLEGRVWADGKKPLLEPGKAVEKRD